MSDIKPIKRAKELVPLSQDHHDGLLLVWKIRQGIKKGIDKKTVGAYITWFWQNHLLEHFREEEEILAPHLPQNNDLLRRMMTEHKEIENLVGSMDDLNENNLERFATLLNDHIRFEERELFPFAEKIIPPGEMEKIGAELAKPVQECAKWENEFWK